MILTYKQMMKMLKDGNFHMVPHSVVFWKYGDCFLDYTNRQEFNTAISIYKFGNPVYMELWNE